jgi:hypothetical protein
VPKALPGLARHPKQPTAWIFHIASIPYVDPLAYLGFRLLYFQGNTFSQGNVLSINSWRLQFDTRWMCLGLALALAGCAGSSGNVASKVYAPEEMPEICQDIDFNSVGADLKTLCGVKTRNYKAYRNIPEHRNLILPKGGKIVKKGDVMELRLDNTLPVALPRDLKGKILFGEKLRRTFIKSKMDYCEFFPEKSSVRLRLMSLEIPLDIGGAIHVCYTLISGPSTGQRNPGSAGHLEELSCTDFERLKMQAHSESLPQQKSPVPATGSRIPTKALKP